MRNSFHSTIVNNASGGFDGDDLIDVKSVSIPSTGQPPLLDMHDNPDSGRYLVSFRVQ
jgi:hypothetical protein